MYCDCATVKFYFLFLKEVFLLRTELSFFLLLLTRWDINIVGQIAYFFYSFQV